jgi:hypothetical protein
MVSAVDVSEEKENNMKESKAELDSHANMPVVGRNAYIISDTGRIAGVNPFTPDYNSMQISIVDAVVWYECPYDGQTYIFVLHNALLVPLMRNNLIPPPRCDERGWDKSERLTKDPDN